MALCKSVSQAGSHVVVYSLFNVAPIACGFFVLGHCFVI